MFYLNFVGGHWDNKEPLVSAFSTALWQDPSSACSLTPAGAAGQQSLEGWWTPSAGCWAPTQPTCRPSLLRLEWQLVSMVYNLWFQCLVYLNDEFNCGEKRPVETFRWRSRETAQQLRALVLAETRVPFPASTWKLRAICNSSSRGLIPSSNLYGKHTHTYTASFFIQHSKPSCPWT